MTNQYQEGMRYLGPAALTAASLVLLLATDRTPLTEPAPTAFVPVAASVRTPPTVLPDNPKRREALPRKVFTGAGFDACSAPALDTMRAWRKDSPYGAVGIYISGGRRACDQSRLTADWVKKVRAMGWALIPTHVGLQAPCSPADRKPKRIDPARAVEQGGSEAAEAVRALKALGLGKGSPVYLDIESYTRSNAACSKAVVDFALGWTRALHDAGYHSGFYSSADSGIADLATAARAGNSPLPDAVWYARWDDRAATDGRGALGDGQWVYRQRIHQYRGDTKETYGGAALAIDRDQLDALVAV